MDRPGGHVFYVRLQGFYGMRFFEGDGHGAAGVGPPAIYVDGNHGEVIGAPVPWKGTVADIFVQAEFPVHSGRILGLPGRPDIGDGARGRRALRDRRCHMVAQAACADGGPSFSARTAGRHPKSGGGGTEA